MKRRARKLGECLEKWECMVDLRDSKEFGREVQFRWKRMGAKMKRGRFERSGLKKSFCDKLIRTFKREILGIFQFALCLYSLIEKLLLLNLCKQSCN